VNADPPAYRYEMRSMTINKIKDRCREKLLDFFIALRREIEDEEFLTQCRHWMKKTEKRTTHRKGIPQGAPIPPGKHLSARSRPIDKKKNAEKVNKKEKRCFGSVRYADGEYAAEQPQGLPAVIAELTRWAAQNPMEIGNQRRIPAIRKTQKTEAEDHEMQHNKGQTKRFFEGRSESIRMETGRRGERKIFEPASCKQQRLFSRIALPHEQWIRWAG
jgi:hypothetical protein